MMTHEPAAGAGERLCATVRRFHDRGWCSGTGGNFSAVLSDDPVRLLITRSGRDNGDLTPDDLVVVDGEGAPVRDTDDPPSAETPVHCAIVESKGARSVLHTHSTCGTLLGAHWEDRRGFTIAGYEMLKGLEGIETHEARVFVPVLPNTQDITALSVAVTDRIGGRPDVRGFLIAGHGLYTWGTSIDEARRHVEIFEFLFECVARRTVFRPYAPYLRMSRSEIGSFLT